MITVRVRLYATLRSYCPDLKIGEAKVVQLSEGATVRQLIAELGIPENTVKKVFNQGKAIEDDYELHEGDNLGIFPPIAGG